MKYALTICLVFSSLFVFAQSVHKISLSNEQLELEDPQINFIKVIDGRESRSGIGWVQTGMMNTKRRAIFEQSMEAEISSFLERALATSKANPPVLIRINHLSISEQTKITRETAKAELSLDFFLQNHDGIFFYISSSYASVENAGMDVTHQHPANIAKAFSIAFQRFSEKGGISQINMDEVFSLEEIRQGATIKIDYQDIALLNASTLKDGIYVSFEEFRNLSPGITDNYIIKEGNKAKVWMLDDSTGSKKRIREGVYAVVKNNQAYILFHKAFYPLEQDSYGFYFVGPHVPDASAVSTGAFLGGVVGGAIAASASGGRTAYTLNLMNGAIIALKEARR